MLSHFNFDTRFDSWNACIIQTEDKYIYFLLITLDSHIILTIL